MTRVAAVLPTRRRADGSRADPPAQRRLGVLLVAPTLLLIGVYFLWPLARAFQVSLYEYTGLGSPAADDFVGLGNYARALADPELWASLARNLLFAAINLAGALVIGSVLAYQLYRKIRGWRFLQIAVFIPHILPVAVVALLWRFIYQPTIGLLDSSMAALGIGDGTTLWLGEPALASFAVGFVWAWTLVPFAMLIIFVGMLRIPEELTESARLEGASEAKLLRHVVLPVIAPTLWLVAALVVVASFRSFDLVYIMTAGGPGYSTTTAALYTYRQAFEFNAYGYASALGFVIAVVLALILPFIARQMRRGAIEL